MNVKNAANAKKLNPLLSFIYPRAKHAVSAKSAPYARTRVIKSVLSHGKADSLGKRSDHTWSIITPKTKKSLQSIEESLKKSTRTIIKSIPASGNKKCKAVKATLHLEQIKKQTKFAYNDAKRNSYA